MRETSSGKLQTICRKALRKKLLLKPDLKKIMKVDPEAADQKLLGVLKNSAYGRAEEEDRIGQVTGLAWTEVGGDLLTIEASCGAG